MRRDFLISFAIFILFAALYSAMAAPGLDWGDAGEAQLAAWTGGLSHPTGYPLFLILGWLWTHTLALVGIAPPRAMTLFSVVCGAGAVAALVPTIRLLLARAVDELDGGIAYAIAVGGAVAFGLSTTFWSQALLAEVYTLHILFLVLVLALLWRTNSTQYLSLTALVYGLALGHHRTMILWLPAILLWLWQSAPHVFRPRALLGLAGCILLPQLLYLYIPLRGLVTPYLHQPLTDSQTLNLYDGSFITFANHILGTTFASDVTLREPVTTRLAGLAGLMFLNVGLPTLVAALTALMGLATLTAARRADALLLLTGGGLTLLFGWFYAIGDVEVMFIPAWLVIILAACVGVGRWLTPGDAGVSQWAGPVTVAFLLALVARERWEAQPPTRADHTAPRELVTGILEANPPTNPILVTNDRNEMVPLWYVQFAEGQRQDVLGLFPLITAAPEHRHVVEVVEWALQFDRPVLLTKPMPGLALRYRLEPYQGDLVQVLGLANFPSVAVDAPNLAPDLVITGWVAPDYDFNGENVVEVPVIVQPTVPLTENISLSLQLFHNGERIAGTDIGPDVFYPPTAWQVGEPLRFTFAITRPPATAGTYEWRLSAYTLHPDGTYTPYGQQVTLGRVEIQS